MLSNKKESKAELLAQELKRFWSTHANEMSRDQSAIIYGCVQTLIAVSGYVVTERLDVSILGTDLPEKLKAEWNEIVKKGF